jgi:hypothetical protein
MLILLTYNRSFNHDFGLLLYIYNVLMHVENPSPFFLHVIEASGNISKTKYG